MEAWPHTERNSFWLLLLVSTKKGYESFRIHKYWSTLWCASVSTRLDQTKKLTGAANRFKARRIVRGFERERNTLITMITSHQLLKVTHDLGRMMSDPISFLVSTQKRRWKRMHCVWCVICIFYVEKRNRELPNIRLKRTMGAGCLSMVGSRVLCWKVTKYLWRDNTSFLF